MDLSSFELGARCTASCPYSLLSVVGFLEGFYVQCNNEPCHGTLYVLPYMSCHVVPRHVMRCHAIPRHGILRQLNCHKTNHWRIRVVFGKFPFWLDEISRDRGRGYSDTWDAPLL